MSDPNLSSPETRSFSPAAGDEPISLVETKIKHQESKRKTFGDGLGQQVKKVDFTRPMNINGTGATRCRVFHSKVADAPLKVMQAHINEWLDSEGIEVKQGNTCIGTMQGKSSEPNVIVLIWY